MENSFEPNIQPVQPTQPAQPVQPVSPVQSSQPVQPVQPVAPVQPNPVFQPTQPAQPVQPFPPVNPAVPAPKKNKGMMIALIGILAALVIVVIVVCVIAFMPKGGTSGPGNSTGGDSGNSGSVSKYANLPDTIDSCPGCVYTYTADSVIVYTPNNSSYTYKSLTSDQYKTSWKDVVEDSGRETFLGFILDDNNYPVRAYSCLLMEEKDTVFCLEGGVEDKYGGSIASRTEFYKSDKESLDKAFPDSTATIPDYLNDTDYKKVSGKYQALINLDGSSMRGVATTYDKDWVFCSVFNYGVAVCNEYWLK